MDADPGVRMKDLAAPVTLYERPDGIGRGYI
jgi:hypothetical protein